MGSSCIHLCPPSLAFSTSLGFSPFYLGWEDPLEEGNGNPLQYSCLENPMDGGGGQWQPTPVFLPRESYGRRSLAGYSPLGHTESDMTEHTRPCLLRSIWQQEIPSSFSESCMILTQDWWNRETAIQKWIGPRIGAGMRGELCRWGGDGNEDISTHVLLWVLPCPCLL